MSRPEQRRRTQRTAQIAAQARRAVAYPVVAVSTVVAVVGGFVYGALRPEPAPRR